MMTDQQIRSQIKWMIVMTQNEKGTHKGKERCFPDSMEDGKVCLVMTMNA